MQQTEKSVRSIGCQTDSTPVQEEDLNASIWAELPDLEPEESVAENLDVTLSPIFKPDPEMSAEDNFIREQLFWQGLREKKEREEWYEKEKKREIKRAREKDKKTIK